MKLTFAVLISILLNQLSYSQSTQDAIQEIRSHFKYVNENLNRLKYIKEETFEESTDGGIIHKYLDDGNIVKIRCEYYGETGKLFREYYIKKNKLLFVFDQDYRYNMPYYFDSLRAAESGFKEWFDPSKTKLKENRFYYYNDNMIRWINSEGEFLSIESEQWLDKEKYYLEGLKSRL